MKRFFAFLLVIYTILMLDCSPAAATAEPPETSLFLTVSSITFSVVGETEDIYLGVIPRELVTWESENPAVVSVENGVLTAVGKGTTTIHATYEDRQVSCAAGCLAKTQAELESLSAEVLRSPKRLPPEVNLDVPCTYFDDDALLGDSITYFLWQYESKNNYLGNVTFLTRNGISIHGLVLHSKNIYFQGSEMVVEEIVSRAKVNRVYILMGCLDFQVPASREQLMKNWNIMLDRITAKCPNVEIVLISNIPCFTTKTESIQFNRDVVQVTGQLRQLAADRGFGFIDLGCYITDHLGRMPQIYCKDEFHMNDDGSQVWIKLMRHLAQFEKEGGSLLVK